ncbi:MAG: alkaline phosphatase family protein, partial [Ignavibacteria bacterium]|nr:alkaline phosphatase family protein [Ignavibacteria bacterium]
MTAARSKRKIFLFLLFLAVSLLKAQTQPYVLLISFDGYRWDYVNRNITSNISELSERGVTASSLRPVFP